MVSSINRRSFMSRIIGGAALSGTALSLVTGQASAQSYTGRSDSDPSDRSGYGHNQTGVSDRDSTDLANQGRNQTGVSDRDSTDLANQGRNQTGRSDSDSTDLANQGRGTGCTDSDSGEGADRVSHGRCPN